MNRVLLCIMDGWGISKGSEKYDATKLAEPVNVPRLIKEEVSTRIHADGMYVGLPEGQMGNSEVGHLNLGAGRIVYQDLSKINKAIKDGDFFTNEKFLEAIAHAKKNDSALHIYGLVSTGGKLYLASSFSTTSKYSQALAGGVSRPSKKACT